MSPWWVLVGFAVFCLGLTKSGFGSGLGLFAVPVVTLSMAHLPGRDAAAGIGFLAPLLVAGDLIAVAQHRRSADWAVVRRLAGGSLAGVCVGGGLLWGFGRLGNAGVVRSVILIEIGLESVGLVSLHWWVQRRGRGSGPRVWPEPARSRVTGAAAGVSSTLAHGAGPIVANYLLPMGLSRGAYVGTSAAYFFALNLTKVPFYAVTGEFAHASPLFAARFLPVLAAGAAVGFWINRRMRDAAFVTLVYAATFALGWYVLAEGLSGLRR